MLETLILLAVFTTLVVIGVHSVTRNDKLLWFLGVRIHARDKALDLQDQMTERLDAAFDRFESKIEAKTKEMQDISNAIDEFSDEGSGCLSFDHLRPTIDEYGP